MKALGTPRPQPQGSPIVPNSERRSALAAWSQLAWFVAAALVWSGALLSLSLDPDYTAGELLDHLAGWKDTGLLYPPLGDGPTLRVLNYPPLVLLLARGASALGLPALAAGRSVNMMGLLALVAAVGGWARVRGARGAALAGTVGLLGASFPLLYGAGQFHIELWAAAGTVAGFGLLERKGGWRGAALGGACLAVACFAKQTQAIPALAALGWVWTYRRRSAPAATAAFAGVGLVGAVGITTAWGMEPWRHMLTYTVGTYSLSNLGLQALSYMAPWLILLAFTVRTAADTRDQARRDPLMWYWAVSLVWSLSAARVGSSYPYFLDLHLATALWVGPRLFGARVSRPRGMWAWLLAFQVVGANVGAGVALATNVVRVHRVDAALPDLCRRLGAEGPLLAEDAGLARACGHPAVIHPFIMSSLHDQGLWDAAGFEADLRGGAYRVAVLPFDPRESVTGTHAQRWTPGMLAAFRDAPSVEAAPAGFWVVRW